MTVEAVDKEDTAAATISDAKFREEGWTRWGKMGEGERGTDSMVGFSALNKTVIPCSFTWESGD